MTTHLDDVLEQLDQLYKIAQKLEQQERNKVTPSLEFGENYKKHAMLLMKAFLGHATDLTTQNKRKPTVLEIYNDIASQLVSKLKSGAMPEKEYQIKLNVMRKTNQYVKEFLRIFIEFMKKNEPLEDFFSEILDLYLSKQNELVAKRGEGTSHPRLTLSKFVQLCYDTLDLSSNNMGPRRWSWQDAKSKIEAAIDQLFEQKLEPDSKQVETTFLSLAHKTLVSQLSKLSKEEVDAQLLKLFDTDLKEFHVLAYGINASKLNKGGYLNLEFIKKSKGPFLIARKLINGCIEILVKEKKDGPLITHRRDRDGFYLTEQGFRVPHYIPKGWHGIIQQQLEDGEAIDLNSSYIAPINAYIYDALENGRTIDEELSIGGVTLHVRIEDNSEVILSLPQLHNFTYRCNKEGIRDRYTFVDYSLEQSFSKIGLSPEDCLTESSTLHRLATLAFREPMPKHDFTVIEKEIEAANGKVKYSAKIVTSENSRSRYLQVNYSVYNNETKEWKNGSYYCNKHGQQIYSPTLPEVEYIADSFVEALQNDVGMEEYDGLGRKSANALFWQIDGDINQKIRQLFDVQQPGAQETLKLHRNYFKAKLSAIQVEGKKLVKVEFNSPKFEVIVGKDGVTINQQESTEFDQVYYVDQEGNEVDEQGQALTPDGSFIYANIQEPQTIIEEILQEKLTYMKLPFSMKMCDEIRADVTSYLVGEITEAFKDIDSFKSKSIFKLNSGEKNSDFTCTLVADKNTGQLELKFQYRGADRPQGKHPKLITESVPITQHMLTQKAAEIAGREAGIMVA